MQGLEHSLTETQFTATIVETGLSEHPTDTNLLLHLAHISFRATRLLSESGRCRGNPSALRAEMDAVGIYQKRTMHKSEQDSSGEKNTRQNEKTEQKSGYNTRQYYGGGDSPHSLKLDAWSVNGVAVSVKSKYPGIEHQKISAINVKDPPTRFNNVFYSRTRTS